MTEGQARHRGAVRLFGGPTGSATSSHVIPMPAWCNITGWARLIIAVIVLGCVAVATGIWGGFAAFGFTLFTSSATLIIMAYYIVALLKKPVWYNHWAILGLEIFGVLFWLISFALCADWTAAYNSADWYNRNVTTTTFGWWSAPFSPEDIGLSGRSLAKRATNKYHAGVGLAGAAAGLGAVEFVLFVATLVMFSINLHKFRMAGTHNAATTGATTATTEKTENETQPGPTAATLAGGDGGPQVVAKDSAAGA